MGKAMKKDKSSFAQKKEAFWASILTERLADLRGGLTNTAMEAHTRNEDGLTSIMLASLNGKLKSLNCLLDWYERRREQRRKGWIDIKDDSGRTALMMAAAAGRADVVDSLMLKEAKYDLKDDEGMTARDHAVKRNKHEVVKLIDEWLADPEDEVLEDEDGNTVGDGLTARERSKLKKQQLQAAERRGLKSSSAGADDAKEGGAGAGAGAGGAGADAGGAPPDDGAKGPRPIWPEVAKVVESVEQLRPIQEVNVVRDEPDETVPAAQGSVDPALYYLRNVNRLSLRLAPGVLTALSGPDLCRMRKLHTLILSDNALQSLPEELGFLQSLKVLEVARNQLTELPPALAKCAGLQVLDASFNKIASLKATHGLENLATLNVAGNSLSALDLDFASLGRLHDLIISNNAIEELPAGVGLLAGLDTLNAENMQLTALPVELTELKKVTVLKIDRNPIKDSKVAKMAAENNRKELWKYIQKKDGKSGKGMSKKAAKKAAKKEKEVENDKEAASKGAALVDAKEAPSAPGDESDDSFDITMEEL